MSTHDISSQFLQIFGLIYDAVIFCWRFLDSIRILNGVTVLDICLATLLIGTFLPIIIGLAGRGVSSSSRYARSEYRRVKSDNHRR